MVHDSSPGQAVDHCVIQDTRLEHWSDPVIGLQALGWIYLEILGGGLGNVEF